MTSMTKAFKGLGAQAFAKSHLDEELPMLKRETRRNTRENRSPHTPAEIVYIKRQSSSSSLASDSSFSSVGTSVRSADTRKEEEDASVKSESAVFEMLAKADVGGSVRRGVPKGEQRSVGPVASEMLRRARESGERGNLSRRASRRSDSEESGLRKVVSFSSLAQVVVHMEGEGRETREEEVSFSPPRCSRLVARSKS